VSLFHFFTFLSGSSRKDPKWSGGCKDLGYTSWIYSGNMLAKVNSMEEKKVNLETLKI
jgi:hypothetical protein